MVINEDRLYLSSTPKYKNPCPLAFLAEKQPSTC